MTGVGQAAFGLTVSRSAACVAAEVGHDPELVTACDDGLAMQALRMAARHREEELRPVTPRS